MQKSLAILAGLGLALFFMAAPSPAQEDQQGQNSNAQLEALNDSGASGTATVSVQDNQLTVTVQGQGVSPGLPHAQHIHIGGTNECPGPDADQDGDGLVNTAEGQPAYGAVQVSLTTEGDASAESALAVERFPVADDAGALDYSRTFDLPDGVTADDVSNGVVVVHGISELFGDSAQYDGEAPSSLDESLPLEATIPTACGALSGDGAAATGQDGAAATGQDGEAAEPQQPQQPTDGEGQVTETPAAGPETGFGGTADEGSSAVAFAAMAGLLGGIGTLLLTARRALRTRTVRSRTTQE